MQNLQSPKIKRNKKDKKQSELAFRKLLMKYLKVSILVFLLLLVLWKSNKKGIKI
jgi:hypothetical protein